MYQIRSFVPLSVGLFLPHQGKRLLSCQACFPSLECFVTKEFVEKSDLGGVGVQPSSFAERVFLSARSLIFAPLFHGRLSLPGGAAFDSAACCSLVSDRSSFSSCFVGLCQRHGWSCDVPGFCTCHACQWRRALRRLTSSWGICWVQCCSWSSGDCPWSRFSCWRSLGPLGPNPYF